MKKRKLRLSIILPTYNESGNIKSLVESIKKHVEDIHEIIVVDDDSPDGTADIIDALIKSGSYSFLKLIRRKTDRGLTKSIKAGISLATGDIVGWMDCDFSMPPKYLPVLTALINADYDIAVGSRFVLGGRWRTKTKDPQESLMGVFLSRVMNMFIQVLLDHRFRDYTSGFVVARRTVFDKIELRGDYGEYFIDLIFRALKHGFEVVEIPYKWVARNQGTSKTGSNLLDYLKKGWKYIATTIRLRFGF